MHFLGSPGGSEAVRCDNGFACFKCNQIGPWKQYYISSLPIKINSAKREKGFLSQNKKSKEKFIGTLLRPS